VVEHVWDLNSLLDEGSLVGSMLKALFGYNGDPSLTEVLAYMAYIGAVFFSLYHSGRRQVAVSGTRT
jgi:high-affinity iron transporter